MKLVVCLVRLTGIERGRYEKNEGHLLNSINALPMLSIGWPSGLGRCVVPAPNSSEEQSGSRGGYVVPCQQGKAGRKRATQGRDFSSSVSYLIDITGTVLDLDGS